CVGSTPTRFRQSPVDSIAFAGRLTRKRPDWDRVLVSICSQLFCETSVRWPQPRDVIASSLLRGPQAMRVSGGLMRLRLVNRETALRIGNLCGVLEAATVLPWYGMQTLIRSFFVSS